MAEARVGARIADTGADCLVIDAEGQYEGHYLEAQLYMRELRRRVGDDYPVGLTSFPYVSYHPSLPFSVFLGPGGADFNVPQMYWRAIGVSVDSIYRATYAYNRVYERPIYPLGQIWQHPPAAQIRRFRALADGFGATGVSWWSWQEGSSRDFTAVGSRLPQLSRLPRDPGYPSLNARARGDLVIWAQQHLLSAGARLRVTARMDLATRRAVAAFKRTRGIVPANGSVDATTWQALLTFEPAPVTWRARTYAVAAPQLGPATAARHGVTAIAPPRFPSHGDELRSRPGG